MMNYLKGTDGLDLILTAAGVWLLVTSVRWAAREYRARRNIRRRLDEIKNRANGQTSHNWEV